MSSFSNLPTPIDLGDAAAQRHAAISESLKPAMAAMVASVVTFDRRQVNDIYQQQQAELAKLLNEFAKLLKQHQGEVAKLLAEIARVQEKHRNTTEQALYHQR